MYDRKVGGVYYRFELGDGVVYIEVEDGRGRYHCRLWEDALGIADADEGVYCALRSGSSVGFKQVNLAILNQHPRYLPSSVCFHLAHYLVSSLTANPHRLKASRSRITSRIIIGSKVQGIQGKGLRTSQSLYSRD